ncbi:hypothetical protein SDC9_72062 [bioreactor metagenome]|uniref:DUF4367 domain-containing protein n=1 Tax=bioreactor metagenome TaxID=1076179 RepID=A0A644YAH6_9ZZZZ
MPGNADMLRIKLYGEYEESLFRLVMHDAAEREGRRLLAENERLKQACDPLFTCTDESVKHFESQLQSRLKKDKHQAYKQRFLKAATRLVAAVLAVTATFSLAMVSVEAFRVRVMNLLIDVQEKYTSFQLSDDGSETGGSDAPEVPASGYCPGYIPDGYELADSQVLDSFTHIIYKNAADETLVFGAFSSSTNLAVDSENASRNEPIEINGNPGTLIVKEPMAAVVWQMDGKLFLVQGSLTAEEAVKIAESVAFTE